MLYQARPTNERALHKRAPPPIRRAAKGMSYIPGKIGTLSTLCKYGGWTRGRMREDDGEEGMGKEEKKWVKIKKKFSTGRKRQRRIIKRFNSPAIRGELWRAPGKKQHALLLTNTSTVVLANAYCAAGQSAAGDFLQGSGHLSVLGGCFAVRRNKNVPLPLTPRAGTGCHCEAHCELRASGGG